MSSKATRFAVGNKAAQKYSVEKAREIFEKILIYLEQHPRAFFLNQACNALGYYAMLPVYLLTNYGHDPELIELADRIESIIEERVFVGSATGKLKEATMIFFLKAKNGWRDTPAVEQAPKVQVNNYNIESADKQDLKALKAALLKVQGGNGPEPIKIEQRREEADDEGTGAELIG